MVLLTGWGLTHGSNVSGLEASVRTVGRRDPIHILGAVVVNYAVVRVWERTTFTGDLRNFAYFTSTTNAITQN